MIDNEAIQIENCVTALNYPGIDRARVLRYLCDRFGSGAPSFVGCVPFLSGLSHFNQPYTPGPNPCEEILHDEVAAQLAEAREEIRKHEIEEARLNVQLTKLAHEFSEMCSQEKQSELLSELLIVDQKNKAIADERERCAGIAAEMRDGLKIRTMLDTNSEEWIFGYHSACEDFEQIVKAGK